MKKETDVATDGGNERDSFDAEFAAAREAAQQAETSDPGDGQPAAPDQPAETKPAETATDGGTEGKGGEADKEAGKPPLPYEELNKRWRDSKGMAHQERERRRAVEAELERLRAQAQPQTDAKKEADALNFSENGEDPLTDLSELKNYAQQLREQQAAEAAERAQQQQVAEQRAQTMNAFQQAEAAAREHMPQYDDAAKHLQNSLVAELQASGLSGPQLEAAYANTIHAVAERAMAQDGTHPAAMVYQLAVARGYNPQAASPTPAQPQTPATPAPQGGAVAEVEARAKAEAVTQTISGSGGGATGSDEISIEQVNSAKGDDFDRMFAELRAQQRSGAA